MRTKGDENKMTCLNNLGRRSFLKITAALGGASTVEALPNLAGAQQTPQQTDAPAITLQDVPFSSGAKLTIERRGQIVLFGINRPYIQNRIDPETFEKLAEAYYQYDHDPSLRAAILFGHGESFSRGIDVEGFKSLAGTGKTLDRKLRDDRPACKACAASHQASDCGYARRYLEYGP
jgi:enoyl-CoA hydratase